MADILARVHISLSNYDVFIKVISIITYIAAYQPRQRAGFLLVIIYV